MEMKLDVDKATIEYIKKKGNIINVELYTTNSCCVAVAEPTVKFGKPELEQQFDEYIIDDITIYISKFIESKGDILTIKLNKFLGIKNISVYGVKI